MKLEHIALTVSNQEEITNFYLNILGFTEVKRFTLTKDLSDKLFGISLDTPVFHLQNNNLVLEIFVYPNDVKTSLGHICISVINRETLVKNAESQDYETIRVQRDGQDLIFIGDKSGNLFEIKNSMSCEDINN